MPSTPEVRPSIGFWSGVALLTGTMIGGGIFRTPASIAAVLPNPVVILGLWVFFGVVCLCGALTLAELATMLPKTGGMYVYLRAAFGDGAAFVFGWLYLVAAIPSGMAALAVFLGELGLGMAGLTSADYPWGIPLIAIAAVVALSAANIVGVRLGASIQNVFAVIKVGALLTVAIATLFSGAGDVSRWVVASAPIEGGGGWAAAVKSVLFTYNGWVYIGFMAGELKDPERNLTRIIFVGTGTTIGLYLSANLAYLYLIPLAAMPGTVVAKEAVRVLAGPLAASVMGACILASVFGSLNGVIMTKARVAYALGRDGLSFSWLGRAHPTRATPYVSILIQGLIAVVLILVLRDPARPLRLFDRLTAYFVMVEWLALVFGVGAIFVLRRTMADARRPYRTPGYPVVPAIFVGGTGLGLTALLWSACSQGDFAPLWGVALVAAGFPVYQVWRRWAA